MRQTDAQLYTQKSFKWEKDEIYVLGVNIQTDRQQVIEKNYSKVLKKVENRTELLSLEGKVIVTKG